MQCFALTSNKQRCPQLARGATNFCDAHQNQAVAPSNGKSGATRLGGLVARWFKPSGDGGKYDVPKWLNDAPTPQVIHHLQTHPDSMARWMAAFVLRKRRASEAIEPLWHALQNDDTRFVRQQCAVALGKIGSPLVFSPLVEALNHDHDAGVRQACAIALGNLALPSNFGNQEAMQEIARVVEREESIFVKWDCIVALGQLGDTRVEKLLLRLQAEEIAQVIRDACREALAEIRQRNRMMTM